MRDSPQGTSQRSWARERLTQQARRRPAGPAAAGRCSASRQQSAAGRARASRLAGCAASLTTCCQTDSTAPSLSAPTRAQGVAGSAAAMASPRGYAPAPRPADDRAAEAGALRREVRALKDEVRSPHRASCGPPLMLLAKRLTPTRSCATVLCCGVGEWCSAAHSAAAQKKKKKKKKGNSRVCKELPFKEKTRQRAAGVPAAAAPEATGTKRRPRAAGAGAARAAVERGVRGRGGRGARARRRGQRACARGAAPLPARRARRGDDRPARGAAAAAFKAL